MKLCMATCYFSEFTPEEMLRHFTNVNCEQIELSTEHSQVLVERGGDLEAAGRAFRKLADDTGVEIPQGHLLLKVNITDDDRSGMLELMKKWLTLYAGIGIKAAVIHPGGKNLFDRGLSPADINAERAATLRTLADFAKGSGITICIENTHSEASIGFADGLVELIQTAGDDGLGICLDTGHLNISGGKQSDFIRTAGKKYLRALHLHENNGSADQHVLPYSLGTIDWTDTMRALGEIGFDGAWNYEIPLECWVPAAKRLAPLHVRYIKFEYIHKLHKYLVDIIK